MEYSVQIEQLLKAGAHFGHLTRRWNPKMDKFIFGERNGIHILDLRKTQVLLELAKIAIRDIAATGKPILYVGTKQQAKSAIKESAEKVKIYYAVDRWLGGMLTNFSTIRKSIKRLESIDKMSVDGTYDKITKKERLTLERERERLRRVFGGIEDLNRQPGAIFIVDIKKEHLAVAEAKKLGIPVFAIVDTNCDPTVVDYPIPANDDSIAAIELIVDTLTDAIKSGSEAARAKQAEFEATQERIVKEGESNDEAPKVQRKLRERKRRNSQTDANNSQVES